MMTHTCTGVTTAWLICPSDIGLGAVTGLLCSTLVARGAWSGGACADIEFMFFGAMTGSRNGCANKPFVDVAQWLQCMGWFGWFVAGLRVAGSIAPPAFEARNPVLRVFCPGDAASAEPLVGY